MANIGRDSTEQELSAQKFDVIFNTILNLIIPFKECIEQLSSGVPEKQRDAIASCVMDATFIAVAFVGAPGKVIATAGKGASVVTKLLAASRIGARTVASILNPLDGVPTLLKGGAKLISKGARTLRTHVIAQLHHLTGANSYDLIRALNHTGAASQIRMGLDSVAHARALFKDDSITTIEQVVTRLSDKKLPNGASPEELQHLFDSSIREAALQSKQAQNLGALIGEPALGDVLASYLASMPIIRYTDEYHTAQRLTETLATVAELEAKKAIYLTNHQQNLLKLDLGKGPYHSVLPESAFNPNGFTDPVQRAGAWMANGAVSQANDYENFVAVLREYAANNKSLTDPVVIAEVHSRLVPAVSGRVRVAGQPTQYGSSITGFALLEQHLKILDSAHQHVDKHLLAAVIGFQSFADGNGRTASAMYAISQLRSGGFTPLSREAVDVLSGIR